MTAGRNWLIWSNYHRAWHRRGSGGGANGYTDRIGEAGIFDDATAMAYHRNGRDVALKRDGRKVRQMAKRELARLNAERTRVEAMLGNVGAIMAKAPPVDDIR